MGVCNRRAREAIADSSQNAKNVSESQAEAVEMKNRGFQGAGEGIYLGDNEQARAVESAIYRSNATPTRRFNEFLRGGGVAFPPKQPKIGLKDKNAKAPCQVSLQTR